MTDFTTLQQQIAVTLIPSIGRRRMRNILNHTGSVEQFFKEKKSNLIRIPGIGEHLIRNLNREQALQDAFHFAEYAIQMEHTCLFFEDSAFPVKLNECCDAPLMLYGFGNMNLSAQKVVAIVGTRKASLYGKELCEELIASFAGQSILVVSGLAYGIDIHIHQLCIKYGVQTIGVLGHGLDRLYPSTHRRTAKQMLKNGGLLTEFLPGTNPDRENFPMRNRIVAGIADATIVIESGIKGGSLITAEFANDYNRDVFAFPGDVNREYSKGCNFLIQKNKAHLMTSSRDFFTMMDWEEKGKKVIQADLFSGLNADEKSIIQCFKDRLELSFEYLISTTNLNFAQLSSSLLNLEFIGLIKPHPGKRYQLMGNK